MTETAAAPRSRRWLRILPIALIAVLFVGLIASGALHELSLQSLASHKDALVGFVRRHPVESLAAFLAIYVLVVVACTPGPAVLSVTGGFLFGPLLGGVAALASMVAGALVVFAACRTAFGDWAAHRAGPTIARIEHGFSRDAFSYLMALRLMPVAPFFAVNLAAGLARVRLGAFALATLVGAAPSAFIFATLGSGLGGVIQRHQALDAHLLLQPRIAGPLTALAVLSLAAPAWRVWKARRGRRVHGSVAGDGRL